MRILRFLVVGSVFGLSVLAIGFVSADRLAHLPAAPAPRMVQAPLVSEPQDTGSIPSLLQPGELSTTGPWPPPDGRQARLREVRPSSAGKPAVTKTASAKPAPTKPKATDGFDTERLNALLRGDPITPPRR
ncbi:hypothetical protein MBUL_03498 [Methylobacterium bullatum]|uniref:Uncharacterized protein n=1 Tax=Methylobacterium bullatum TaxID=570505 RepID=A0A679J199_9HYPH|nr:hypothetical protein MBUL_03498 [Methylobacterium bullatum]